MKLFCSRLRALAASSILIIFVFVDEVTANWKPEKPIEMVVMAHAGSGTDTIARLLGGLIESKRLSPQPFKIINKPDGSGAEALVYLKEKDGDDHTLLVSHNSLYSIPWRKNSPDVDVTLFTPISLLALDPLLLWVHSDQNEIFDLDSYIYAVGTSKKNWKVGGSGAAGGDLVLSSVMELEMGYEVTYIPFKGGSAVAKGLANRQVDSTINSRQQQHLFYQAGISKPIVQYSNERMSAFPDIPTAKESGYDIEFYRHRSINGPSNMSIEAQDFYIELFSQLYKSEEWQSFCTENQLLCKKWVAGDDLNKFHLQQLLRHKPVGAECDRCCTKKVKTCCASCMTIK